MLCDWSSNIIVNIWVRGKMLGLTTRQIKDALDDIADFTEFGDYLHVPIRAYSTGMSLRLAFGISTAITPEILVLDEMIGTGDAAFIARADARLKVFLERIAILVIANHSMSMLRQWCDKRVLLEHGKMIINGPIEEVISVYES